MTCRTCEIADKVPWSEFIQNVMIYARKAPPDVAEHFVRVAAIEFVQRVMPLNRDIYVDTQKNVADYSVTVDDGYVIKNIKQVCLEGMDLPALRKIECGTGRMGYYFEPSCSLLVNPVPDSDGKECLFVSAAVSPSHSSCFVDKWLFDSYAEDIATGALSRILLMKDSGWYDVQAGGIYAKRWAAMISRAKVDKARANSSAPVVFKARRWV